MAPLKLTNKDVDLITRLVATEADHRLVWSHPEEYTAQVHGIVDTVLNRVASGHWGSTVSSVANAKDQFSDINGPKGRWKTVENVPDSQIPAFLPNIVNSWITARKAGTPSSVGGGLHYANPKYSDAKNLKWINALDGPKLGFGNSIHFHGTAMGMKPVEAVLKPLQGTEALQAIQDKNAAAQGYGVLPPQPKPRSALEAARARLVIARQQQQLQASKATAAGMAPADKLQLSGPATRLTTDPLKVGAAGLAATPRLPVDPATATEAQRMAATANVPKMDVSSIQARAIAMDEGVGSLLNPRSVSPSALNPVKQPVAGLRVPTGPTIDPKGMGATAADLAAFMGKTPAPVPLAREARPQSAAAAETKTPAAAPKMVQLDSGKMAKVGDTAVIGGKLWTVEETTGGKGKLVKTDAGILGEINSKTVAGGVVREKVGEAIGSGTRAAADAAKPVVETVTKAGGDLLNQAGNFLGGLFGGAQVGPADTGIGVKLSVPLDKPTAGTTLAIPAVTVPKATTLSAPGAGLTAAQRNAMTSLAGTGITNAIAPIPATMPAGLRGNALPSTPKANPITVSKPATQPTQQLYQAGGYIYAANPGGGYMKVGKVAQGSSGSSSSSGSSVNAPVVRSTGTIKTTTTRSSGGVRNNEYLGASAD